MPVTDSYMEFVKELLAEFAPLRIKRMFGGAGVMNVGHGHPAVIEAATEQIGLLTHTLDIPSPARVSMVEALLEVLPEELALELEEKGYEWLKN